MKSLTLIIDMQSSFRAANNPATIEACQELIRKAMETNSSILFVEYKWNGKTMKQLTSMVKDYPYVNTVQKQRDDGSTVVKNFFNRCKSFPEKIIVGGVNTDFCVKDTVLGLAKENVKISLVRKACHTEWPTADQAIKEMRKAGVKIV